MQLRHLDSRRGIAVIDNFLTEAECDWHIRASERRGYAPAPITTSLGPRMAPGVRNNTRVMVDDVSQARTLWERLTDVFPEQVGWEPAGLNERFRYYRYARGERFNWHFDGSYVRNRYNRSFLSLLFYLNEDFTGGQTQFGTGGHARSSLSVKPRAGMALFFPHRLLHTGAEVTAGVKYVLRTDVMYAG